MMTIFNKNLLSNRFLSFKCFEKTTLMTYNVIFEKSISIPLSVKSKLQNKRKLYVEQTVHLKNIPDETFLTANSNSFEALIMTNNIANVNPILPRGAIRPDEFYINIEKKMVFIIEKKTQNCIGSADEKIQTAPFKKYVLSKKFKKG